MKSASSGVLYKQVTGFAKSCALPLTNGLQHGSPPDNCTLARVANAGRLRRVHSSGKGLFTERSRPQITQFRVPRRLKLMTIPRETRTAMMPEALSLFISFIIRWLEEYSGGDIKGVDEKAIPSAWDLARRSESSKVK